MLIVVDDFYSTAGSEIFLHLYQNSVDNKEHLAIVFGDRIRSKSLDAVWPGETEMDRMIRGAYTGRLHPGRTSSRIDDSSAASRQSSAASLTLLSSEAQKQTMRLEWQEGMQVPLVRIHSECYTGEIAWSARCDCGEQLDEAARLMSLDPAGGVVVYLRQEGRGIGLGEKLKAYNLQDLGNDTVQANLLLRHPADARSYGLATAILQDLELVQVRLLTNNPDKIVAVEGPNKEVRVVERVPMIPLAWKNMKGGVTGKEVSQYLRTKVIFFCYVSFDNRFSFYFFLKTNSGDCVCLDYRDGTYAIYARWFMKKKKARWVFFKKTEYI
jgi:GTP cyclohydrolase II